MPKLPRKPPVPVDFFGVLLEGYSDDDIRDFFKKHEQPVEFLYRDSENYPTVGVGHLLSNVRAALEIPFVYESSDGMIKRPATPAEIKNAYEKLPPQPAKRQGAYRARWFDPYKRDLEPLFLPASEIDRLLDQDIRVHVKELQTKFRGFGDYPAPVRKALLDMQFNMGGRFTPQRWPKFFGAVRERDWKKAAQFCRRRQVGAARDNEIRALFLSTAEERL